MRYINTLILVGFTLFSSLTVAAQQSDQVKAMKVSFITSELSLTSDEAEKFWPVYNEYNAKKRKFRKQFDRDTANGRLGYQEATLQLDKEYIPKFKTVLPEEKVDALFRAEKNFNQKLLEEAKRRRGN